MPLVPLLVQGTPCCGPLENVIVSPGLTVAQAGPDDTLLSMMFVMQQSCARTGLIAAGKPVAVNVVALLVPVPPGRNSVTTFPVRAHAAVAVGLAVKPVYVIVNVPVSGVMSTRPAATGPLPRIAVLVICMVGLTLFVA